MKELLDHANAKMIFRYAHLVPAHRGGAVEILTRSSSKTAKTQKLYNQGISFYGHGARGFDRYGRREGC